nr:hypothetical protein [Tanacetum cinerariifolium]
MPPITLNVHLAAVFEHDAMEEAHWGAFYRINCMELSERIRQRDDVIANIQFLRNRHNIQTVVAYLRELQLGDIGKLDWFRAMAVDSHHYLLCKRWFLALGWHLEEIHITWTHLEKKRTRLRTYTKSLEELCEQCMETALQA